MFQVLVGLLMEMRHGSRRVSFLFLLGVISSSLAFYCFDDGQLFGASGGLYCLIVSGVCTTILNWKEDRAFIINYGCFKSCSNKGFNACGGNFLRILKLAAILLFVCLDFGWAFYLRLERKQTNVSVLAHCFGSLAGFLAGFIVLRNVKERAWEKKWKMACFSIFLFLFSMGLGGNVFGNSKSAAAGLFGYKG